MDLPQRHKARHRAACATVAPPPHLRRLRAVHHADGRTAYPDVIQYQLYRWDEAEGCYLPAESLDLPPMLEEHQDDHMRELARASRRPFLPTTVPYIAIVHDLAMHDHLRQHGLLDHGHSYRPGEFAASTDNRAAPGA